jgi:hypothetical protein
MMPWHIYEAPHSALVAEIGNRSFVEEFLSDLGLFPYLTSSGLPIAMIGAVEYRDGAAGAYNEMYVSFAASKTPSSSRNALFGYLAFLIDINPYLAPLRTFTGVEGSCLVVWKMYVTTQRSLLGGREVWGCQ